MRTALCLCCACLGVMVAGCRSVEKQVPEALALPPPVAVEERNADPDNHRPPEPVRPPLLTQLTPPNYAAERIPPRPAAIGRLEAPLGRDWKHIVIHHSYTDSGSEAIFDKYHRQQRGWLGVGYHFVIGNGNGSPDGAIEVTFRWEEQLQGAHAGVEEYNQRGIGICLVGDFERGYPTTKQMASLVALVNYLQQRCRIPASQVLLHRHLKVTECPGRNFPFYQCISMLDH